MTIEQYERWKDFALRMASTCFRRRRNPTAKDIKANVAHFFDCADYEEMCTVVDWEHSDPYPEGHRYFRRSYRCPCWHCKGQKRSDCRYNCENGQIFDYASPMCVTDRISEMSESFNPYYWGASDAEYERRDEQFCGPVRCCIRAGLDIAVSPSAGVAGFTAGDIRRMYPEGVPDWVAGVIDQNEIVEVTGVVPGIGYTFNPTGKKAPAFATLADDEEVHL